MQINPQWERRILAVIVIAFISLAVGFSFGPTFEGPDEIEHYEYIRILVETRSFPNPYTTWGELHQAPLYYMLASPISMFFDDPDFEQFQARRNPYHGYEIPIPSNDNKNVRLHTRAEAFPHTGSPTALGVHVLRLFSVVIGLGTLLTSYAIFRILWPDRPDRRLLATGFVAFLPEFVYMSSVISNDTLLYFWTTLSLYFLLRMVTEGPSWRLAVFLGLGLGAALLTEVSAVFLVFPVAVAVLSDRRTWRYAIVTLAMTLIVAGWWYTRNLILYGDPTGVQALSITQEIDAIQGGRPVLGVGLSQITYAYRGFWGRFGYGAVVVSEAIYTFFELLTALTLIGLILQIVRFARRMRDPARRPSVTALRQAAVVVVFALAWVGALLYWSSVVWTGNQGRFLLTSVANWGALFAFSLDALTPRRVRMQVTLSTILVMFAVVVVCLFGYFFPAYRVLDVPETIAYPLALRYGDDAELIGISPANAHARPGDVITITLYWRALRQADTQWQTYLHSVDSPVVRRDSYPATGNLLATDWQPGDTWAERYVIRIPEDIETQVVYPLVAGLYDPEREITQQAFDAAGNPVTPVVGSIAINGPAESATPVYCFGESIGLAEPELTTDDSSAPGMCLQWISLTSTPTDYQVFVHVLAQDGTIITQADHGPKDGRYPTSAWQPGEVIRECFAVDAAGVPAGDWQVGLGLYNLDDGQRLPVRICEGDAPLENNIVIVAPDAGGGE